MAEAFAVVCYGRRWVKLADLPEPRSLGWASIVWTANVCHAERWLTAKAAEDFARCNLRGDGWSVEPLDEIGMAFA